MRIAICDDEEMELKRTKDTLESSYKSLDLLIDIFLDGKKLIQRFDTMYYDLVILDIEMPGMNGIETAKALRSVGDKTAIVFLTSHVEYALKGYEVNALRYLTKPATIVQLLEIITYLIEQKKQMKKLLLKSNEDMILVTVSDILYLEARNQDIRIVTAEQEYMRRYNLRDYEQELSGYNFVRNHRSYLINLAHISKISGKEIVMDNGERLPLSRTKEGVVKGALNSYIQGVAL